MERRLSASEGGKVFQFLFFDPNGVLYGVTEGKLYKGDPPEHHSFNWIASATLVGGGGWNVFKFLFFDPQGVLYGVQNDRLSRGYLPTDPPVNWIDNSQLIGTGAWGWFSAPFLHGRWSVVWRPQ